MKIVNLLGGLGNQMFQYAFGIALKNANLGEDIKYDVRFYSTEFGKKEAHYGLEIERIFSVRLPIAAPDDHKRINEQKASFKRKILRRVHSKHDVQIEQAREEFYPWVFEITHDARFLGYWQSEKYFHNSAREIKKTFRFPSSKDVQINTLLEKIHTVNAVSIHVRRGDYVDNEKFKSIYDFMTMKYYNRAIAYILEHVENPVFYVFSDDIVWTQRTLLGNHPLLNFVFVDFLDKRENYFYSMEAMSRCKHNIIAHSTFSWWGAWLNDNDNKIVIAPNKWYADTPVEDYKKITDIKVPSSWLLMEVE